MVTASGCAKAKRAVRVLLLAAMVSCSSTGSDKGNANGFTGGTDGATHGGQPETGGAISTGGASSGGADSLGSGGSRWPCTDTSSDPHNCGACGTVCGSVQLVSGQSNPAAIAVDATSVYWANEGVEIAGGTLMKMALGGGTPVVLAEGQNFGGFVVDGTSVYWTNPIEGTVMKVPTSGGTAIVLASNQPSPYAIAVDAANLYWSTYSDAGCPDDGGACSPDGTIVKVPLDGGTPSTLASGLFAPGGIAVDAANIYWTSSGINIRDGAIMKVSLGGGTPVTLASQQYGVTSAIAVSATAVFWTGNSGGTNTHTVRKVPISGGDTVELVTSSSNGAAIAVDATNVYWVDHSAAGGRVMSLSLDGGSPTVLADVVRPGGLAIDATNVYWSSTGSNGSNGSIMTLGAKSCVSGVCQCPGAQVTCFGTCVDPKADGLCSQ